MLEKLLRCTKCIFAFLFLRKRERFSTLAVIVARCLLHVPGQQSFNLSQRVSRRNVLQYMM